MLRTHLVGPRGFAVAVTVAIGLVLCSGPVARAADLPVPRPVPPLPVISEADFASTRLVVVPVGCAAPDVEQAVFVGTLMLHDQVTARFAVSQIRSGTLTGFSVGGLVDVRYGDEVRYLDDGRQYLIGAGIDPDLRVLSSRVRAPAPLFGGSGVAGVNPSVGNCPTIADPVRTVLTNGTSVESGVLSPLQGAGSSMLGAVLQAVGLVLGGLFVLVAVKHLAFLLGRQVSKLF